MVLPEYPAEPFLSVMAPTIKQIAEKAQVSIATVSRALANDPRVLKETKELILQTARELDYKPNIAARNLVSKKSNIICLILPDIADEFFSEIIRGVDETAFSQGFYTMIVSSHKNRKLEESLSTFASSGMAGGIIILLPYLSKELKHSINKSNLPTVLIGGDNNLGDFDSVSINNYHGVYEMVDYLVSAKGYTKLAHISGPADNNDAIIRKKAFTDACKKNGVRTNDAWFYTGDFTKESGMLATKQFLALKNQPELIFAANDMMALGCYEVLNSRNIKIPKQMGVVGFDDIFMSHLLHPPLTTIRVSIDQLGRSAADLLIRKMNGEFTSRGHKRTIQPEIVIRKSC